MQSICFIALLLLALLNRSHWVDPKWPVGGLFVVVLIWLVFIVYALSKRILTQEWGGGLLFAELAFAVIPVVLIGNLLIQYSMFPVIHDVSTDIDNPPSLVAAQQQRHASHNSLDYPKANRELQSEAYPDIQPLFFKTSVEDIHRAAIEIVKEQGWYLQESSQAGVIEVYDKTALFGFVDDMVIRIELSDDDTVRVDIRSASRMGKSDLGVNAKRIQRFSNALMAKFAP